MTEPHEPITAMLSNAVQFARTAERLGSMMPSVDALRVGIERVAELEPDLQPEMNVALEHLGGAVEAVQRAITFLDARFDSQIAEAFPGE